MRKPSVLPLLPFLLLVNILILVETFSDSQKKNNPLKPVGTRGRHKRVPQFDTLPQFNTSVPHKDHTFSAPKIPQFNSKNPSVQHPPLFHTPSVQHPKSLSSTPKTPQLNTASVPHPLSSAAKKRHQKNLQSRRSSIFVKECLPQE